MTKLLTVLADEELSNQQLTDILQAAGIEASVEDGAPYQADGVAITTARIREAWNHDTGANECGGRCGEGIAHLDWDELSPEQRKAYGEAACRFMSAQQYEYMLPTETLSDRELDLFNDVALSRDDTDDGEEQAR